MDNSRFSKEANKRLDLEKATSDPLSIHNAVVCHDSLFKIDETKNKVGDENRCWTFIKQKTTILFWIERVVLISICIAIAGGFTVPIIIYALDADQGNTTRSLSDFDLNSCSNTTVRVKVCKYIHACS